MVIERFDSRSEKILFSARDTFPAYRIPIADFRYGTFDHLVEEGFIKPFFSSSIDPDCEHCPMIPEPGADLKRRGCRARTADELDEAVPFRGDLEERFMQLSDDERICNYTNEYPFWPICLSRDSSVLLKLEPKGKRYLEEVQREEQKTQEERLYREHVLDEECRSNEISRDAVAAAKEANCIAKESAEAAKLSSHAAIWSAVGALLSACIAVASMIIAAIRLG